MPATKQHFKVTVEFRVQAQGFRGQSETLALGRLVSIRSAADDLGRLGSIAIRTADLAGASAWATGTVGHLLWNAREVASGEPTTVARVGPLRVAYNLPSFDEGSFLPRATIILVPLRDPDEADRPPGPPPIPPSPPTGPFRGVVITPNNLGDGWVATFHGFSKSECGLESHRGSAASVGAEVHHLMKRLGPL